MSLHYILAIQIWEVEKLHCALHALGLRTLVITFGSGSDVLAEIAI